MILVYSGVIVCIISFIYIFVDYLDFVSIGELCVYKIDCKYLELRKI